MASKRRNRLYPEKNTNVMRRSHPDEPVVKAGEDERKYWRIMELIPDNGDYSSYDRLDALTAYAILGNMKKVQQALAAKGTHVNYQTLCYWRSATEWWKPALHEVREMLDEELDARQTKLINSIMDEMEDRLENGEEVVSFDKEGNVRRASKKVGFRDLAIAGGVQFDKRQLGRGEPTSRVETISDKDRLIQLQNEFKRVARSAPAGRLIEGEKDGGGS